MKGLPGYIPCWIPRKAEFLRKVLPWSLVLSVLCLWLQGKEHVRGRQGWWQDVLAAGKERSSSQSPGIWELWGQTRALCPVCSLWCLQYQKPTNLGSQLRGFPAMWPGTCDLIRPTPPPIFLSSGSIIWRIRPLWGCVKCQRPAQPYGTNTSDSKNGGDGDSLINWGMSPFVHGFPHAMSITLKMQNPTQSPWEICLQGEDFSRESPAFCSLESWWWTVCSELGLSLLATLFPIHSRSPWYDLIWQIQRGA